MLVFLHLDLSIWMLFEMHRGIDRVVYLFLGPVGWTQVTCLAQQEIFPSEASDWPRDWFFLRSKYNKYNKFT